MYLTTKATNYLNTLKRNDEFSLDRETTIKYFKQQNLEINEILINIQVKFSGYKLTITNDSGNSFLLRLFSKTNVKNNDKIEVYHFGNAYVIDFGGHNTAPFQFYITDLGELCTLGHNEYERPNIVCSSIEKFIEKYALQNELVHQAKTPYYDILNYEALINLLNSDFTKIDECSDKYSQWFTNEYLTIDIGTWLDRQEFYLHIYGQKEENCKKLILNLKQNKIIE